MTDKQLAMLLKQYEVILSLIRYDLRDELLKSKKFRKENLSVFNGKMFYTVPVLDELDSFIEGLNNNTDVLSREKDRS